MFIEFLPCNPHLNVIRFFSEYCLYPLSSSLGCNPGAYIAINHRVSLVCNSSTNLSLILVFLKCGGQIVCKMFFSCETKLGCKSVECVHVCACVCPCLRSTSGVFLNCSQPYSWSQDFSVEPRANQYS